jgi:hypothetical protein
VLPGRGESRSTGGRAHPEGNRSGGTGTTARSNRGFAREETGRADRTGGRLGRLRLEAGPTQADERVEEPHGSTPTGVSSGRFGSPEGARRSIEACRRRAAGQMLHGGTDGYRRSKAQAGPTDGWPSCQVRTGSGRRGPGRRRATRQRTQRRQGGSWARRGPEELSGREVGRLLGASLRFPPAGRATRARPTPSPSAAASRSSGAQSLDATAFGVTFIFGS